MDLGFLDKAGGVTPLLVRLYDSQKLQSMAKDKQPQARAELGRAVTELLERELSPRETELVADVLIALLKQAEKDLRQALAERLSAMEGVPLRVALHIANDGIDIAEPLLRNSPALGDMDLIYIIKSKTPDYWRAIAQRKKMSDQVQNMLADTQDFDTALELTRNLHIKLTSHALTVLSDIAQGHDELGVPLLRRDEITKDIAIKLYQGAGHQLKSLIAENFEIDTDTLVKTVDEVVLDFIEAAENAHEYLPTPSLIKAAERFRDKGLLTPNLMMGSLKRGQISAFIAQFSKFCGLSSQTVLDVLKQANGQGLAVACRAYGIERQDFTSIFLLTNRVRNAESPVDVQDLTKAMHYFDAIHPDVAAGIMKNTSGGYKAH